MFFMVLPWWASIFSLFVKPHVLPSQPQRTWTGIFWVCLWECSWHYTDACSAEGTATWVNCVLLMSTSKLLRMLTEPGVSKGTEVSCHSWKFPAGPVMFLTYLFHPGHYILLQSQLTALDFSQAQAFPNLLVREPHLFGSPQCLFWNCFAGIK